YRGHALALQTVCDIIANPFYYGVMKVKGKLYRHSHPILIDRSLSEECQKVAARSFQHRPCMAVRETRKKFLSRGMVTVPFQAK
ncbi:MAG: hypothetical protein KGM95_05535, partial [Betaproteobacteria bacterium]|nr:hypothetical protein [Betaproteobacteria bacterium]